MIDSSTRPDLLFIKVRLDQANECSFFSHFDQI